MNFSEKMACTKYFTEEAKTDKDPDVRLEYYRINGFTEEAKTDEFWMIRLEYYQAKGFTEDALDDEEEEVREEARLFFNLVKEVKPEFKKQWSEMTYDEKLACAKYFPEEAKKDEDPDVRIYYYRANGFTEEAKIDKYWGVRLAYYRANGFTEEALDDEEEEVREEAEIFFSLIDPDN